MSPYPDTFQESISLADYVAKYGGLSNGSRLTDHVESLAGRIVEKRSSSEKLFLYDLYDRGVKIGVTADARDSDMDEVEFSRHHSRMKHGDFVGICGHPGKSENGEPSIFAKKFMVLSHCLHMLPSLGADDSSVKERGGKSKANIWVPGMKTSPETFAVKDKICNAYSELNDPVMKLQRFVEELKNLRSGDGEAVAVDDPFCNALGYELPQTGCWGMGIERLTMSLTESQNIKASLEEKLKVAEAKAARAEAARAEAEVSKKLALEKAEESNREALEEAARKAEEILYLAVEAAVRRAEEEALAKYRNSEGYIGKCVQAPMEPTCYYQFLSEEPGLDLAPEPELELKQFCILENDDILITEDMYIYLGA